MLFRSRLVVPFSPGGGNDIAARFVAVRLTEGFNQSAVVDNRPGAGSTLGTDLVAKSVPDGYTLLVTHNAIAINQTLYSKLPYDTTRDLTQVAIIGTTTNTLARGRQIDFLNTMFITGNRILTKKGRGIKEIEDLDRKSTRLNSSHSQQSRMPSSA